MDQYLLPAATLRPWAGKGWLSHQGLGPAASGQVKRGGIVPAGEEDARGRGRASGARLHQLPPREDPVTPGSVRPPGDPVPLAGVD